MQPFLPEGKQGWHQITACSLPAESDGCKGQCPCKFPASMLPRRSLRGGGSTCRYIARLGKGSISVYELPDMGLLDKKSIKLEGVHEFAWSPSQPILCAYQTEQAGGNLPARISLIGFPEKTELRQKNLFSVSGDPLLACKAVFLEWPELFTSVPGRA